MSASVLLDSKAKEEVVRVVRELEAKTSAEIVVTVRAVSGHYRHTDWLVGALCAFAALCVFLFHPAPLDDDLVPFEVLAAFALGALLSAYIAPLRRALTSRRLMESDVKRAARAAFVDQGVSRTAGRTGLLVYVSTFEQRVEIVADLGLDGAALGEAFVAARRSLEAATRASSPRDALIAGLRALGAALADKLPRAADDVNELPDEVRS